MNRGGGIQREGRDPGAFQTRHGSRAPADLCAARRTPRASVAMGALAAVALWLAFPASAEAAVRIMSPASEAVVPSAKVRIALAVSAASSVRVALDGNDITRRFTGNGRVRRAVLRGRLVEPGAHRLRVRWRTPGKRALHTSDRRFMVARRLRSLARIVSPRHSPHVASGLVRLRLTVGRGVALMRVRVNGRRVHAPHYGRLSPAVALTLGARHGVRFGRNRVQVLLHDFRKARYDLETRTVVVRRNRPLAAGISEYRAEAGGRELQLDGRGARPTIPRRQLNFSWRLVRRPAGSQARLVGTASATPRLAVDVRGRYRLALRVSERGGRATSHTISVLGDTNALPIGASLEIDLGAASSGGGAITIDEVPGAGLPATDCATPAAGRGPRRCTYPAFFVDQNPYFLVLDALTLEPKAPIAQLPLCASDDQLQRVIDQAGQNVIAILIFGGGCGGTYTGGIADFENPAAYIFTPNSSHDRGIRSGWYSEAPTMDESAAEISGFLQKSWPVGSTRASEQYQFVPGGYVQFDTSTAAGVGKNTMTVAGKEYTSEVPGDAYYGPNGFQVLVVNNMLQPILGTPKAFQNGGAIEQMAQLLAQANAIRGATVFVQSIGTPAIGEATNEWNDAAKQIEALGGSKDVFLTLDGARPANTTGWYSLVAAPGREEATIEASTPLTQRSGDVSGILRRNERWQYEPLLDQVGGANVGELLTLAYQPAEKWPYSDQAHARTLDYIANYSTTAVDLTPLGNGTCYDPGPQKDVRSSYCNIDLDWATIHSDLGRSGQPGTVCGTYPGQDRVGVDATTYAAVCDQIAGETERLADLYKAMNGLKTSALDETALVAYLAVKTLVDQVQADFEANSAKPNRDVTAEALKITGEGVEMLSLFAPEPYNAVGEFLGSAISLSGEIVAVADEQGESAVHAPVTLDPAELGMEMENRLATAGAAFDHIWDMLVSDPARLQTAYENFEGAHQKPGIWTSVPDDLDKNKPYVQNGVRHWAAGKFMAATYDVWLINTLQYERYRDVTPSDLPTIGCAHGDFSAHWHPFRSVSPDAAYYFRDEAGLTVRWQPDPEYNPAVWSRRGNNIWLLAQTPNLWDEGATTYYPPQTLLNALYSPPSRSSVGGGYGWERPWLYSKGQSFTFRSQDFSNHCEWFDRY
jgi:hypothetical protein